MIPVFFVSSGVREARASSSDRDMHERPSVPHGRSAKRFEGLLADETSRSGPHTQDWAPGLSHNLMGVRQRRTVIERTMVIET